MLYAVPYTNTFSSRKDETAFQRELVRRLLGWAMKRQYGVNPADLKMVSSCRGKPAFSNHLACFSLSHCPGLVCCTVGEKETGVDAEPVRPYHPRLARRICTPNELALLQSSANPEEALTSLWTLKESLMKLTGEGMRFGFQNASFRFEHGKPVASMPGVQAACFTEIPGYIISVCCQDPPPERLEQVNLEEVF